MQLGSDPDLPPELERLIFIYAYQNRGQDPTNLFLVAKQVRNWLLPIAFNVVIVHSMRYFPIKFTDISQFHIYGRYIHHLLILSSLSNHDFTPKPDECVSLCPNLINLALWWTAPPVEPRILQSLHQLTRLSINMEYLINQIKASGEPNRTPRFPNITHLDALGRQLLLHTRDEVITKLGIEFPGLTHLAVLHWTANDAAMLQLYLDRCRNLKALVWWNAGLLGVNESAVPPLDDERIISINTSRVMDWENDAIGRDAGMWGFVDGILEMRKEDRRRRVLSF